MEHFRWNEDFTLIIPLTAIGRVTLNALQLNRPNLLNLRMATFLFASTYHKLIKYLINDKALVRKRK